MLMLSVHVTSVLFLVRFNNFALTMYGLLLELHALTLGTKGLWGLTPPFGVGTKGALGASTPLYLQCVGIIKCFHTVHSHSM